RASASTDAEKLDGIFVPLIRQAGDAGQLYGSVSARDIATEVSKNGVAVDKRQVRLDTPIKALGLYPIRIDLHPEVSITVTANVARSAEEADIQAKTGRAVVRTEEDEAPEADAAADLAGEAEKVFDNPDEAAKELAERSGDESETGGEEAGKA
ncbi:MAG: 50S ribosomal L9 C-terminal domain-containing protein, partial [Rhodospirillales bacterium]